MFDLRFLGKFRKTIHCTSQLNKTVNSSSTHNQCRKSLKVKFIMTVSYSAQFDAGTMVHVWWPVKANSCLGPMPNYQSSMKRYWSQQEILVGWSHNCFTSLRKWPITWSKQILFNISHVKMPSLVHFPVDSVPGISVTWCSCSLVYLQWLLYPECRNDWSKPMKTNE